MKKNKSIVSKLIVTFSLITIIVLAIVGLTVTFWVNLEQDKEQVNIIENQIELIEESLIKYLNQENYEEIKTILKMTSVSNEMDVFIVDDLGYIYIVSDDSLDYLEFSKIKLDEKLGSISNINKTKKVLSGDKITTYIKPIYMKNNIEGYVVMKRNDFKENDILFSIWTAMISAVFISMIVITYFVKRLIVKPLSHINIAAQRLAKGDVEQRVEVISNDEIGQLAESFNSMAESLETVDITRKEFISNVSHELRSPITSIKGFVGGILDGVIPKGMENYYLNIVHDEIERLTRLVNDLLDISTMESGKFTLNKTKFDINEVIQICILNLENKIKDKGLDVRAIFNSERRFVLADRDRIIQVLTNLLENAIKYSNDSGKIKVVVETKSDKVYIKISNTGANIPKEDMKHIWDRFYKIDKSRSNKISTGLGLPIVRLILRQHDEDIWVENIENKGVQFIFTLKIIN